MHTIGRMLRFDRRAKSRAPHLRRIFVASCLVTLLAGDTAVAQSGTLGRPVSLHLNGGFQSSAAEFRTDLPFTLYGEDGQFQTDHRVEGGAIVDAGGSVTVWRQLALGATFTELRTSDTATLAGSVPHPLVVGRPRSVGSQGLSFEHRERATHIQIAWVFPIGGDERMDLTISGGPSFFSVTRDVLGNFTVTETAPPFSEVLVDVERRENTSNGWGGARRSRCDLHGNVRVRPRRVRQIRDRICGYPDCDRPGPGGRRRRPDRGGDSDPLLMNVERPRALYAAPTSALITTSRLTRCSTE